jgi:diketogulonate reductase-like aldo/keto reductase
MTILNETYALSNGVSIPKLGLGTWFIEDDQAADAVKTAVEIGYRNIDTAQAYGNERGVGEGIRSSGVSRSRLFVSTKLAAEIKDYDGAVAAIDGSLRVLSLDYIDLMLIHSPSRGTISAAATTPRATVRRGRRSKRLTRMAGSTPSACRISCRRTWTACSRRRRSPRTSTSCSSTPATRPATCWPTAPTRTSL